ncbi:MAG: transposase, partial [Planctomycetota bacterium]
MAPRDRDRLEALCRYAARPAVSESRLAELPDGRIGYALKRRFADGTTAVVMTNAVLMERLCALVPPPRKHLVTYHGVLAPASGLR